MGIGVFRAAGDGPGAVRQTVSLGGSRGFGLGCGSSGAVVAAGAVGSSGLAFGCFCVVQQLG
jgi:hypothetical protein